MGDLERLRALKAELLSRSESGHPEPGLPVAAVWRAGPPSLAWHSTLGEDPRPDLPGSADWTRLLHLAAGDSDDPQGTYGRLLAARACGAILALVAGRWRLVPVLDPSERVSVWATLADWNSDSAVWLGPRTKEIREVLRQLPVPEPDEDES